MEATKLKLFFEKNLKDFPYKIEIKDWEGNIYFLGQDTRKHWAGDRLIIKIKTESAGKKIYHVNSLGFIESFLEGEIDLEGNLYILPHIQDYTRFDITLLQKIPRLLLNKAFQTKSRSKINVKSHYDIPQEALSLYLDKVYMGYSCGIFENPSQLCIKELLKIGEGKNDEFDSLEKSQWRKFKDAVDFINPKKGETLLDIGCGYGGQLRVALENYPFGKVVGWTYSKNQTTEGKKLMSEYPESKWKINEGDYRQETTVFDHITSTGMACHVGPRGLAPYVKKIKSLIKKEGRYVHHVLMTPYEKLPIDFSVGTAFNKKYVWPGYHWFTLGDHIKALEENGFEVVKVVNLSEHYRKTTAAWYERMVKNKEIFIKKVNKQTFRAWQLYLGCGSENFYRHNIHVYRIYCQSV